MDDLVRVSIVGGPASLCAGKPAGFDLDGAGKTQFIIHAVQCLKRRSSKVAFLGGRLFADGHVITAWGWYDTETRTGDLWVFHVPKQYAGYY